MSRPIDVNHMPGWFELRDDSCTLLASAENTRLYSWGWAACRVFSGDPSHKIAVMYVEFCNVDDPLDEAAVPTFDATADNSYYWNLSSSPNVDYLRLLLPLPEVAVVPGYEAYFAPGKGNMLVFKGKTGGATGINGKPFAWAANSKITGAAIAAAPFLDDLTQDVLVARAYYAPEDQQLKQQTGQFEITYKFTFG